MEHFETISGVAITFSGLAGIVSILSDDCHKSPEITWRAHNLILLSLLAFILSLLPQGAAAFGANASLTWQISSALLIAGHLFQFWFSGITIDQSWRQDYLAANYHLLSFYIIGALVIISLQGWNILSESRGAGPFFAGLAWFISHGKCAFFCDGRQGGFCWD